MDPGLDSGVSVSVDGPLISYCATNLDTERTLSASLASIETIARGVGGPFEVVVADGPSPVSVRGILDRWAEEGANRRVVRHGRRNRGFGRRHAFEASHGDLVVPFDTSIVYDPIYGSLLSRYARLRTDRMLFSELCALRRTTIAAVGGWRDLIGGEDVDLYAPVAARFGLIAYPIGTASSQATVMDSFSRQMRYMSGSRVRRTYRMFLTQRDQMIGANYRIQDLMAFNRRKPGRVKAAAWLWFAATRIAASFGPLPRRRVEGANNYLFLRERTIDSMVREGFRELDWPDGPPVRLPLTVDERTYLASRSELWRRVAVDHSDLFPEKR